MRISNYYDFVAVENLDEVTQEIVYSKMCEKLYLGRMVNPKIGYVFSDFEKQRLDVAYLSMENLKSLVARDKSKSVYGQVTLLVLLKGFSFEGADEGYLIQFDEESREEEAKEENELLTQNSLVKRASSSSLKLSKAYLLSKLKSSKQSRS